MGLQNKDPDWGCPCGLKLNPYLVKHANPEKCGCLKASMCMCSLLPGFGVACCWGLLSKKYHIPVSMAKTNAAMMKVAKSFSYRLNKV